MLTNQTNLTGDEFVENLFVEVERVWIHGGQIDVKSAKYLAKLAYDEGVKYGMSDVFGSQEPPTRSMSINLFA